MTYTTYKNPWYDTLKHYTPEYYETTAEPIIYGGYLIYKRLPECYDVVKNGVCISQMAGLSGAKQRIDWLTMPPELLDDNQRFWVNRSLSYLT